MVGISSISAGYVMNLHISDLKLMPPGRPILKFTALQGARPLQCQGRHSQRLHQTIPATVRGPLVKEKRCMESGNLGLIFPLTHFHGRKRDNAYQVGFWHHHRLLVWFIQCHPQPSKGAPTRENIKKLILF